jgi:hypothetical protein
MIITPEIQKLATEVWNDRANGAYNGMSKGKGGRVWIDGEFCLDELEALCVLIRAQSLTDATFKPCGFLEIINEE